MKYLISLILILFIGCEKYNTTINANYYVDNIGNCYASYIKAKQSFTSVKNCGNVKDTIDVKYIKDTLNNCYAIINKNGVYFSTYVEKCGIQ